MSTAASFSFFLQFFPEIMLALGAVGLGALSLLHPHERVKICENVIRETDTFTHANSQADQISGRAYKITSRALIIAIAGLCLDFGWIYAPPVLGQLSSGVLVAFKGLLFALALSVLVVMRDSREFFYFFQPNPLFLWMLSLIGLGLALSTAHLGLLFITMELHAFPLYVLGFLRYPRAGALEAGLKYFLLGGVSASFFAVGISLIYGSTGSLDVQDLVRFASGIPEFSLLGVGVLMVIASLLFKLSCAPFHMWTPDVYQKLTTPVMMSVAGVMKIGYVAIFLRLATVIFPKIFQAHTVLFLALSGLSIAWGTLGALRQYDLRRFLAYSTITHMGMLLGLVAVSPLQASRFGFFYAFSYFSAVIGVFASCFLGKRGGAPRLDTLPGMAQFSPSAAFFFALYMISLAGIPPLLGFFPKLCLMLEAIGTQNLWLAFLVLLSAVPGCFFYLRFVVRAYQTDVEVARDKFSGWRTKGILIIGALFHMFFLGLWLFCVH